VAARPAQGNGISAPFQTLELNLKGFLHFRLKPLVPDKRIEEEFLLLLHAIGFRLLARLRRPDACLVLLAQHLVALAVTMAVLPIA
jgi:hypothetical protein